MKKGSFRLPFFIKEIRQRFGSAKLPVTDTCSDQCQSEFYLRLDMR